MTVSIQDVTEDIVSFQKFSTHHVQNAIDDAKLQAKSDRINPDGFDMGVKQYTKYLLSIDNFNQYGGVTASSMMGVSQTIKDPTQNNPYLNQYNNTVALFGNSSSKGSVVFYE
ncbi:hypothetical protein MOO46_07545 (plasmid) [Apilactobacillus apisilvae]|uniref:Uncharacterized protein n=1 Tax=Apilactobacillus apisilvae TaxID=2923364 RepID=A0ABY4PJI6_9LACO|nr:hypothetical protein [Apilactobacillus apisilvae]UQS85778.1 hypothetical protein MOO46_07545 [Apilactobacillus apisilvae]